MTVTAELIIAVAAPLIVTGIGVITHRISNIARGVAEIETLRRSMEGEQARRAEQMQTLFSVQGRQIRAQRATLQVVAQGLNNGNVEKALSELDAAENELDCVSCNAWV